MSSPSGVLGRIPKYRFGLYGPHSKDWLAARSKSSRSAEAETNEAVKRQASANIRDEKIIFVGNTLLCSRVCLVVYLDVHLKLHVSEHVRSDASIDQSEAKPAAVASRKRLHLNSFCQHEIIKVLINKRERQHST
jgi:hypothetical protein